MFANAYHSSIYFGKQAQTSLTFDDHAPVIAQSLANMLLLAEDCFAQLGYISYYKDFTKAVEMLFECVGGSASLSQDAARLANSIDKS